MEFEAPMDGWYTWVAVALVSIGLAGVAVSLPDEPPPDADRAAGVLDRIGASEHEAAATLDHDAEAVRIGTERIAMQNSGGTDRARVSFGAVVPVYTLDLSPAQRIILDGVLAGERTLPASLVDTVEERLSAPETTTGEWRPATGTLRAQAVTVGDRRVVLVAV
jgi:hypothetical protein